ncbi:MAG TPA: hypothetical protein VNK47_04770 [Candidatus Dormibacteraeota bacterium]|nr:hypothetical protein [Candidatus Dormibacteraeota bacterium]
MSTTPSGAERRDGSRWKSWGLVSAILIILFVLSWTPSFHDAHFGVARHESNAVGSLSKINELERQYARTHVDKGFACKLPLLLTTEKKNDEYDLVASLLSGEHAGYKFAVGTCAVNASGITVSYEITAVPAAPGRTGIRAFCTDQAGQLFYDEGGSGPQCLALRHALPN